MLRLNAALSNVLRLLDLPVNPRIRHLGLTPSPLLGALMALDPAASEATEALEHGRQGDADLLVAFGSYGPSVRAVLRPGGWFVVLRTRPRGAPLNATTPTDFSPNARRWLVTQGLHFPFAIIPCTRQALEAHERATRERGWKQAVRLASLRLNSPPREYTGEIFAEQVL